MKTVVVLLENSAIAGDAIQDLFSNGVPQDQISLITRPSEKPAEPAAGDQADDHLPDELKHVSGKPVDRHIQEETAVGAALGGLGGILFSLGVLAIPGLGPVLAAGPLAVALGGISGAGAGAMGGASVGRLIGAFGENGLSPERASAYLEGVRQGKALITVRTEENDVQNTLALLDKYHPIEIGDPPASSDILPTKA